MSKNVLTKEKYCEFAKALVDAEQAIEELYGESFQAFGKTHKLTKLFKGYKDELMELCYGSELTEILCDRKKNGYVSDDIPYLMLGNINKVGRGQFWNYRNDNTKDDNNN